MLSRSRRWRVDCATSRELIQSKKECPADRRRVKLDRPGARRRDAQASFETPSSKSYVISSKRPVIDQALGDWVCKIGTGTGTSGGLATFGRQCGQIYDIDSPFMMNGHTIYGKAADFNGTAYGGQGVSGGDSGASVVYNGQLYGLADTTTGQYSLWNAFEDDLNVSFCMTVTCS